MSTFSALGRPDGPSAGAARQRRAPAALAAGGGPRRNKSRLGFFSRRENLVGRKRERKNGSVENFSTRERRHRHPRETENINAGREGCRSSREAWSGRATSFPLPGRKSLLPSPDLRLFCDRVNQPPSWPSLVRRLRRSLRRRMRAEPCHRAHSVGQAAPTPPDRVRTVTK